MNNAFLLTEVKDLVDPNGLPYRVVSISDVDNGITVDINLTAGEVSVTMPGADSATRLYLNDGNVNDGGTKKWSAN